MFKHLGALAIVAVIGLPLLAAEKVDDKPANKIRVLLIDGQNNHVRRVTV